MALTRSMLKGMGLTEEQVSVIIEEHTNVTTPLKDQIKEFKDKQDQLEAVQKELDQLKEDIQKNDWEKKYTAEHTAFEKFKADLIEKENAEKIKAAYRTLLSTCKVGDKHIDSILKVTDFSGMKLKDDGTLDSVDDLKTKIETDWSGFITTTKTNPTDNPANPPEGNNGSNNADKSSRAAQLAAKYHDNLYGKNKEEA